MPSPMVGSARFTIALLQMDGLARFAMALREVDGLSGAGIATERVPAKRAVYRIVDLVKYMVGNFDVPLMLK